MQLEPWQQLVLDTLRELSDAPFQERVWLRHEGSEIKYHQARAREHARELDRVFGRWNVVITEQNERVCPNGSDLGVARFELEVASTSFSTSGSPHLFSWNALDRTHTILSRVSGGIAEARA